MSNHEEIAAAVRQVAIEEEGRTIIRCAQAFALARKAGVSIAEVGAVCEELDVRITQCQLGCFP